MVTFLYLFCLSSLVIINLEILDNNPMKKKYHQNIQRQISCLIPILESCLSLTPEIEPIKHKLKLLPDKLEKLKSRTNILNKGLAKYNFYTSASELQKIEFELDSLVDDLELILTNLFIFNGKLKNVAILKEKLEAIQEERINGLTPERIYKLLEKQQSQLQQSVPSAKSAKKHFKKNFNSNIWQKIFDFSYKFCDRKIAFSLAIIASLSLGWIAGYSSGSIRPDEAQTVEIMEKSSKSSLDI